MNISRSFLCIVFLACFATGLVSATAQVEPQTTKDKTPEVTVMRHGWTKQGMLVLGVRLRAGSKDLNLGSVMPQANNPPVPVAFSMGNATLTDHYSGQVIHALSSLPRRPFYGTMAICMVLKPGDGLIFGVAFPHPPDPPQDKDGKPQDYKFLLQVPGQTPIPFTFPFGEAAAPAGK